MKKIKVSKAIVVILAIVIVAVCVYPLFYLIIQSLAPWDEVDLKLIPSSLTLKSYQHLFSSSLNSNAFVWIRALFNSLFVCVVSTLIAIFIGLISGYAASKLPRFRGRKFVMDLLLFQMFFPGIMLLVPTYILMRGFANSYTGMIFPMMMSPWVVFMYINAFRTLPDEIFESARIDGAGHLKILWHIALPTTRSITTIVALSQFMGRWNELMWDMLISPNEQYQTLNVLISTKISTLATQHSVLYAASVMLTVPIVILFLACSKNFREGINFMMK